MKCREGFVSNSSSSSFICEVCKRQESGMDMGLEDCEMSRCVNDHVFCDSHLISEYNGSYDVPTDKCPICNMNTFEDKVLLKHALGKLNISREDFILELKSKYKTYEELTKVIEK